MPFSLAPSPFLPALAHKGYATPTPVQAAVLAEAPGCDLLVSAQTGSGKTVAFGLAIGHTLLGGKARLASSMDPLALVIAPTRELALQVERELAWLYADTGARLQTCVGGMDPRREHSGLRAGPHIVVGTPGRLVDHLSRGALNLTGIKAVVLDEADEMLDMGFREDLETLLAATPSARQTLMFSATLPKPIIELARNYQRDARRVSVQTPAGGHADIVYQAMRMAARERDRAIVNILRFHDSRAAMVFCATRDGTARLAATLTERGFAVATLSGDFSQRERNLALQALRDGRARICVATDVAARGLDLPDVGLVLHADLPQNADVLVHRSGRTGRAGKQGTAVLLVPDSARGYVQRILRTSRVDAQWTVAPSAAEIRANDEARLVSDVGELVTAMEDEDRAAAQQLLAIYPAEALVAALVRTKRASRPVPEDVTRPAERGERPDRHDRHERGERPGRNDRFERSDGGRSHDRAPRDAGGASPRHFAPHEVVSFVLDVGRITGADPRWILPELCRRGGITKSEIGKITIGTRDTRVDIVADKADAFAVALASGADRGGGRKMRVQRATDAGNVAMANDAGPERANEGADMERPRLRTLRGERPGGRPPAPGLRGRPEKSDAVRDDRRPPHSFRGPAGPRPTRDARSPGKPSSSTRPARPHSDERRPLNRNADAPAGRPRNPFAKKPR